MRQRRVSIVTCNHESADCPRDQALQTSTVRLMSLPERRIYTRELNSAVSQSEYLVQSCRSMSTYCCRALSQTAPSLFRPRSCCLQIFAKLAVLAQQKLGQPEQLAKALQLLWHLQHISKGSQQQATLYPLLVEILRSGSSVHGSIAVQTTLEIVAVTLRRDTLSCGPLVDLGVVT